MWPRIRRIRGHGVTRQHMHYLSSRNRRAVGLTGILSLTISLLPTVASPASAATDGSGTEDVSIEIVIKSDDEVTMTFLATTPSDDEQSLKDFCVDENFSDDSVKPEVTFSSDHGTPTCKAVVTTPVSGNEYVSHDGDEYVVDTHVDSASEEDKNSSLKLSVVFPGKVTDSGGGRIEGDKQNKVSFTDFYDNKTRGKDSAEVTSESQSDSRSDTRTGFLIAVVLIVFITVVGGMIAFFSNSNKKRRAKVPGCVEAAVSQCSGGRTAIPGLPLHLTGLRRAGCCDASAGLLPTKSSTGQLPSAAGTTGQPGRILGWPRPVPAATWRRSTWRRRPLSSSGPGWLRRLLTPTPRKGHEACGRSAHLALSPQAASGRPHRVRGAASRPVPVAVTR